MSSPAEYLNDLFGMEGKVAVLIGGAGELGKSLATGLAKAGARVMIADYSEEHCRSGQQALKERGIDVVYCAADATSKESLVRLREESLKLTGKIDMLVNCAGINVGTPFLEVDAAKWDQIMAVNLKGTMLACQVFIESMRQTGGGSILNIGSVNSDKPLSRVFAYAASKAAVVNLTQNIAQEFATEGIRINAICPGFFPAEQNRALLDQARVDAIMRGTPMKRYGSPEELVGTAILLLSEKAGSYITGSIVYVDGGFTCSWF